MDEHINTSPNKPSTTKDKISEKYKTNDSTISINKNIQFMQNKLNRSKVKVQNSNSKLKNCLINLKLNSLNFEEVYAKSKIYYDRTLKKLLPMTQEEEEDLVREMEMVDIKINRLNTEPNKYEINNQKSPRDILMKSSMKFFSSKKLEKSFVLNSNFNNYIKFLNEKIKFTKKNKNKLDQSKLINDIDNIYRTATEDGGEITIEGVSLQNLDEFDENKKFDPNFREILLEKGPIKGFSRYWQEGKIIWKNCVIMNIENDNLFNILWDDPSFNNFAEIRSEFEIFKNLESSLNSTWEDYQNFITKLFTKIKSYISKKTFRINFFFENENYEDHIRRYNDAVKTKIIFDYQNVYFKKIANFYKNKNLSIKEKFNETINNISHRSNSFSQHYKNKLKIYNPDDIINDKILKEIFSFNKMTILKVDYEIINNKINYYSNYRPWKISNQKCLLNFKKIKINLLLNFLNAYYLESRKIQSDLIENKLFLTSENLDIFKIESNDENINLIFKFLSENHSVFHYKKSNKINDDLSFHYYLVNSYVTKKVKLELTYFIENLKFYQNNFDTQIFFKNCPNLFFNIKKKFLENKKVFNIKSHLIYDITISKCIYEIKKIREISFCHFIKNEKFVIDSKELTENEDETNLIKKEKFISKMKFLIDLHIKGVYEVIENVQFYLSEKFFCKEEDVINIKDKSLLIQAENYQVIYKYINKQISTSLIISLEKEFEKFNNFLLNKIVRIPLDFSNLIHNHILNNNILDDEDKNENIFTFKSQLKKLQKYFTSNVDNLFNENLNKIFNLQILTIEKYYKNFYYDFILNFASNSKIQNNLTTDNNKELKIIKVELITLDSKNHLDKFYSNLKCYLKYFKIKKRITESYNENKNSELSSKIESSITENENEIFSDNSLTSNEESSDKLSFEESAVSDIKETSNFFKKFKILEIHKISDSPIEILQNLMNKINNKDESEVKSEIKSETEKVTKEYKLKDFYEIINFYDLKISPNLDLINEILDIMNSHFYSNFKSMYIRRPPHPINILKKYGIHETDFENFTKKQNKNNSSSQNYKKFLDEFEKMDYIIKEQERLQNLITSEFTNPITKLKENSLIGIFSYIFIINFYYPFYRYSKEGFKKFFKESIKIINHDEDNNFEYSEYFIEILDNLSEDILKFPEIININIISLDISKIKSKIMKNIQTSKKIIIDNFKHEIFSNLEEMENVYKSTKEKLNEPFDHIDEFIDRLEYVNSEDLQNKIKYLENSYLQCEEIYSIMEKNFNDMDKKLFTKFLKSYIWTFSLKKEKENVEREIRIKKKKMLHELLIESEGLLKEIKDMEEDVEKLKSQRDFDKADFHEEFAEKLYSRFSNLENRANQLNVREEKLGIYKTDLTLISTHLFVINLYKRSWSFITRWNYQKSKWIVESICNLIRDEIVEMIERGNEICNNLDEYLNTTTNFVLELISVYIQREIDNLRKYSSLYYEMRDVKIKEWHWKEVVEYMYEYLLEENDNDKNILPSFKIITLEEIINNEKIRNPKDFIYEEIKIRAIEENYIETNLYTIEDHFRSLNVVFFNWEEYNIFMIKNIFEIISKLKEHSLEIEYIVKNKRSYIKPYEDKIEDMRTTVKGLNHTLKRYLHFQNVLVDLIKIFSMKEVVKELDLDYKKFNIQLYDYKEIISKLITSRNIISLSEQKIIIQKMFDEVDSIYENLKIFIRQYKKKNPRFIFLSEESLLMFISNFRNVNVLNKFISQCFPGIKELQFTTGNFNEEEKTLTNIIDKNKKNLNKFKIEGINNFFNEFMKFDPPLTLPTGYENFADWIKNFEMALQISIKDNLKKGFINRIESDINHFNLNHRELFYQFVNIVENSLIFTRIKHILNLKNFGHKIQNLFEDEILSKMKNLRNTIIRNIQMIKEKEILLNIQDKNVYQNLLKKCEGVIINQIAMREYIDNLIDKQIVTFTNFEIYESLKPILIFENARLSKATKKLYELVVNKNEEEENDKTEKEKTPLQSIDYDNMKRQKRENRTSSKLSNPFLSQITINSSRSKNESCSNNNLIQIENNYYNIFPKEAFQVMTDSQMNINYQIFNHTFKYNFEICSDIYNLIFHPITDKFNFFFATSLVYNFFNMIVGNKSTGKSEITKNFLNILGRTYITWNCKSSDNSYQSISDIIKISSITGYSLIFEDINFIQKDVMSSLTQILINVRTAIIDKTYSTLIEEESVRIDPSFTVFMSYNLHQTFVTDQKLFQTSTNFKSLLFESLPKNIFEHFRMIYKLAPDYKYVINVNLYMMIEYINSTDDMTTFYFDLKSTVLMQLFEETLNKLLLYLKYLDRNFKIMNKSELDKNLVSSSNSSNSYNQDLNNKFGLNFLSLSKIKILFNYLKLMIFDFNKGVNIEEKVININQNTFPIRNLESRLLLIEKLFIRATYKAFKNFMNDSLYDYYENISISIFGFENYHYPDFKNKNNIKEDISIVRNPSKIDSISSNLIIKILNNLNLGSNKKLINYVKTAYEIINNSHRTNSLLIVGNSLSGKSTLIKILSQYYFENKYENLTNLINEEIETESNKIFNTPHIIRIKKEYQMLIYHLNLNALDNNKIFGYKNTNTKNNKEWVEGILMTILKNENNFNNSSNEEFFENSVTRLCHTKLNKTIAKEISQNNTIMNEIETKILNIEKPNQIDKFLVFDYTTEESSINNLPHDNQMEKLIFLLDINNTSLSLSNGDFPKLNLSQNNKFLFETNSLLHITPHFITRSNLLFIDDDTITSQMIFKSFITKDLINVFSDHKEILTLLYENIFIPFFDNSEIQNILLMKMNNKLLTLNLIKYLEFSFYELMKKLIANDVIILNNSDTDQLLKLNNNKHLGYFNFEENIIDQNNKNLIIIKELEHPNKNIESVLNIKKFTNKLKHKTQQFIEKKTDKTFNRSGTITAALGKSKNQITSEESINHHDYMIEDIFMNSFPLLFGPILNEKGKFSASKILEELINNFLKNNRNYLLTNLHSLIDIISNSNEESNNIFDYYFELNSHKWINLLENPFYDSIKYNFCGKFTKENLTKNQFKNPLETSRLNTIKRTTSSTSQTKFFKNITEKSVLAAEIFKLDSNEFLFIPTSNYIKVAQLLNSSISHFSQILIIAPHDSGKTHLLQHKLQIKTNKNFLRYFQINLNSKETLISLQSKIESNLEKKYEGHYMSPGNKMTYIFLDDVNMSKYEHNFKFNNPLELTKEWINYGGWYNSEQPIFNKIDSISFILTYSYNSDNFKYTNHIGQNLLKNFFLIFMDDFNKIDFVNILKSHFLNSISPNNFTGMKEHLANLLIIESLGEKLFVMKNYLMEKENLKFVNYSLKNTIHMVNSLKCFYFNSGTKIFDMIQIWSNLFKVFFISNKTPHESHLNINKSINENESDSEFSSKSSNNCNPNKNIMQDILYELVCTNLEMKDLMTEERFKGKLRIIKDSEKSRIEEEKSRLEFDSDNSGNIIVIEEEADSRTQSSLSAGSLNVSNKLEDGNPNGKISSYKEKVYDTIEDVYQSLREIYMESYDEMKIKFPFLESSKTKLIIPENTINTNKRRGIIKFKEESSKNLKIVKTFNKSQTLRENFSNNSKKIKKLNSINSNKSNNSSFEKKNNFKKRFVQSNKNLDSGDLNIIEGTGKRINLIKNESISSLISDTEMFSSPSHSFSNNNNSLLKSPHRRKEANLAKIIKPVQLFHPFTEENLEKMIIIIEDCLTERKRTNLILNYDEDKEYVKSDSNKEQLDESDKVTILLIVTFIKSIKFLISQEEMENLTKSFFTLQIYNKSHSISNEDDYEQDYQILSDENHPELFDFYKSKFSHNLSPNLSQNCSLFNVNNIVERFFTNILELNFLLELENNFLIIKCPHHIETKLITFIILNLCQNVFHIEAKFYTIYDYEFNLDKFKEDLLNIIEEIIFNDKKFLIIQEIENYSLCERLTNEKMVNYVKEILNLFEMLNLKLFSEELTNLKLIKRLEEKVQMKFLTDLPLEYRNKNFDSLSLKFLEKISQNLKIVFVLHRSNAFSAFDYSELYENNKYIYMENFSKNVSNPLIKNSTFYYFDYKFDNKFDSNNLRDEKENLIELYKNLFSIDLDTFIIENFYLDSIDIISQKSLKCLKNNKFKYSIDMVTQMCKKVKLKMINLFKNQFMKHFDKYSNLYKNLKILKSYFANEVNDKMIKIENQLKEKKIVFNEILEKISNLNTNLEKVRIRLNLFKDHSNIIEAYSNFRSSLEIFINSVNNSDDFEEFKSDIVKKIVGKNTIKIIYFFELAFRNNKITTFKYSLTNEEKTNYFKDYSLTNFIRDNLKKLEIINFIEKEKIDFITEILYEFNLTKTYSLAKSFFHLLSQINILINSYNFILNDDMIKDEDIYKMILKKENDDSIIKKFVNDFDTIKKEFLEKENEISSWMDVRNNIEKDMMKIEARHDRYKKMGFNNEMFTHNLSDFSLNFCKNEINYANNLNKEEINLNQLALMYAIDITFISNLDVSLQKKLRKKLIQTFNKNYKNENKKINKNFFYSYLPNFMFKFTNKSLLFSEIFNEGFLDSLNSFQFLLKFATLPIYVTDPLSQVEKFLINKRKKHCVIESNTSDEETETNIKNCLQNGNYLIVKNLDNKLFMMIKPILLFYRKNYQINDIKIHKRFRLIIIESNESKLYQIYLGNYTYNFNFNQNSKGLLRQNIISQNLNLTKEFNFYKSKVSAGYFYYLRKIQKKTVFKLNEILDENIFNIKNNNLENIIEENNVKINKIMKSKLLSKHPLEENELNLFSKLNELYESSNLILKRKIEKLNSQYPLMKKLNFGEINLNHIYREFHQNLNDSIFNRIKLTIKSNLNTLNIIVSLRQVSLIINKHFKDFYYFSDFSLFESLNHSTKNYINNLRSIESLSYEETITNSLKFLSSKMFYNFSLSMREDHFQIFGFLIALEKYKDSCKDEEEYLQLKRLIEKVFRNKGSKDSYSSRSVLKELLNVNNMMPVILNNLRIDLILEKFDAKENLDKNNSNRNSKNNSNSNVNKNYISNNSLTNFRKNSRQDIIYSRKSTREDLLNQKVNDKFIEENEENFYNSNNNLNNSKLKIRISSTIEVNSIKNILFHKKKDSNSFRNNVDDLDKLNSLPYENSSILKSVMNLLPDLMQKFQKIINKEDIVIINFLKNNYIGDILNNVEIENDINFYKSLTPMQRLIFMICFKCELFFISINKFVKEHVLNNDTLILDKMNLNATNNFIRDKNFTIFFYETDSTYPMKIIQDSAINFNVSIIRYSLGVNDISKLLKSNFNQLKDIKQFRNKMIIFENVHLLQEKFIPNFIKSIYKLNLKIKQNYPNEDKIYFIILFEINKSDGIIKKRKILKEIQFFHKIFITSNQNQNLKNLITNDYKFYFGHTRIKDNPLSRDVNYTTNNNINNFLYILYNLYKEKYNNFCKKIYSNSFLIFSIFMVNNINLIRNNIRKFTESHYYLQRQFEFNPYENFVMILIIYEYFNTLLQDVINLKLSNCNLNQQDQEKKIYAVVNEFVNKNEIFDLLSKLYKINLSVKNDVSNSSTPEIMKDLVDFVLNRIRDRTIIFQFKNNPKLNNMKDSLNMSKNNHSGISNTIKYSLPNDSKEVAEKEILEEIVSNFPEFDHPLFIGINRNRLVKFLYEQFKSNFKSIEIIYSDVFPDRIDKKFKIQLKINEINNNDSVKRTSKRTNSFNFNKKLKEQVESDSNNDSDNSINNKIEKYNLNNSSYEENNKISSEENLKFISPSINNNNYEDINFNNTEEFSKYIDIIQIIRQSFIDNITILSLNSSLPIQFEKIINFNKKKINILTNSNYLIYSSENSSNVKKMNNFNSIKNIIDHIYNKLPKENFDVKTILPIIENKLKVNISSKRLSIKNIRNLDVNPESNSNNTLISKFGKTTLKLVNPKTDMNNTTKRKNSSNISVLKNLNKANIVSSTTSLWERMKSKIRQESKNSKTELQISPEILKEEEMRKNLTIENFRIMDFIENLNDFNIIIESNMNLIHKLKVIIGMNGNRRLSFNDQISLNYIRKNKVLYTLAKITNCLHNEVSLVDWIPQFIYNYNQLKKIENEKFNQFDIKKDYKLSTLNTAESIFNFALYFSILKKVSLSQVRLIGYSISQCEVVKEEEGVFLCNLILFNCHYDIRTNLLLEEKDKVFNQTLPLLYLIAEKDDVTIRNHLEINIMNEKIYKNVRQNDGYFKDENKIGKILFSKYLNDKKKSSGDLKENSVNSILKLNSHFLKNVVDLDNFQEGEVKERIKTKERDDIIKDKDDYFNKDTLILNQTSKSPISHYSSTNNVINYGNPNQNENKLKSFGSLFGAMTQNILRLNTQDSHTNRDSSYTEMDQENDSIQYEEQIKEKLLYDKFLLDKDDLHGITEYNIKIFNNFDLLQNNLNNNLSTDILPFRNISKKNKSSSNEVFNVLIPLVTEYNYNNGSEHLIYLNFSSNYNQLYWNSIGAYAMIKSFNY